MYIFFIYRTLWVARAALEQYRTRSAYKLIELDDKHHFLRRGSVVVRMICMSALNVLDVLFLVCIG